MSAIFPSPLAGDPLRRVIKRRGQGNSTVEQLECGHQVVDYDNRRPKSRRCRQCAQGADVLGSECPRCRAAAGAPCEDARAGPLRLIARRAHEERLALQELAAPTGADRSKGKRWLYD